MRYHDEPRHNKSRRNERRRSKYDRPGQGRRRQNLARSRDIDSLLLFLQALSTLFFLASMAILGILPKTYMAAAGVLLLLLILIVVVLQRRAVKKGRKCGSGKTISVIVSLAMFVIGLYGFKVNVALNQISIGDSKADDGAYAEEHKLPVTKDSFNVYISGIDVYGDIDKESRSDVNLIASVNPNTHKILLTTTPRDYYVKIPGVSGEEKDKLTHAGTYGVDKSMETLEQLYDTEIPFYLRVNFTSVEEIVNVIGGVDVKSEIAFKTSKATGEIVDVKKGMNHFNGKQALAFVRERKSLKGGDNQRGKNQQALLSAMIKKAVSPKLLFHANDMISSVSGNTDTNMSEAQMKSIIRMQVNDMSEWEIESVAAEGSGKKDYCYSYKGGPLYVMVPDESSVEGIKEKIKQTMEE